MEKKGKEKLSYPKVTVGQKKQVNLNLEHSEKGQNKHGWIRRAKK